MIKRVLAMAALLAALLAAGSSSAESVCADAGATGLVPSRGSTLLQDGDVVLEPVCVWVP